MSDDSLFVAGHIFAELVKWLVVFSLYGYQMWWLMERAG